MSHPSRQAPRPGGDATGVSLRTRVLYTAPALALAVVGTPVYVHLPKFYTDVVGVPVASLGALGSNLPGALLLYYVEYVLQSDAAELFLVEYLATGILLLPAWIALSRRLGKKRTWILSMLVNTGAFVGVFFLGPGDELAYAVLVFLSGTGLGATLAIPSSLQADVIDYDELRTGERREGLYIGVWSVSRKAAAALGVGIGLPALGLAGYVPNAEQTPQVVLTLRVLYALVPSACNLAAIALATRYPIERADQRAILEAIERRRLGLEVPDPLEPAVRLGGPAGAPAR